MEIFAAAILIAVLAALVVVGGHWLFWQTVVTHRVMVQLVDGPSIEGMVMVRRGPLLVLEDAWVHTSGERRKTDGRVVIERRQVLWIQVVD